MNKEQIAINQLILKREDIKSQLFSECESIREALAETGLLSAETKKAMEPGTMSSMGLMAAIPNIITKLAPLKECFPQVETVVTLGSQYMEVIEQQLDAVTMLVYKGV